MSEVGILDKSASILRLLMIRPMSAGEIGRRLGLTKSTCYRLLGALQEHGFVVRTSSGSYLLGPFPHGGSTAEVEGVLSALRDVTGESAQLWMRWEQTRACVAASESGKVLRVAKSPGTALHLDAGGSAALALLGGGSPSELFFTLGARHDGVGSASVAFDTARDRRLAVCVSFPLARVPGDAERELGVPVRRAIAVLEEILARGGAVDLLASIAAEARLEES